MTYHHKGIASLAAGVVAFAAGTATAETLPVSAVYAAGHDVPSEFRTIIIERFDGNEGTKFSLALRNAVTRASVDGEEYFDVRRGSGPGEGASPIAWINGTAFSEVERLPSGTTQVTKCVSRDENGKCEEHRTITYSCRELAVRLTGEVQMLDARDEPVYDRGFSTSGSQRYCSNERSVPSVSKMVSGMIERFAGKVRRDLAPIERNEDVRVLESRDGMDKALRKPFKKALKLTKSDWEAACAEFARLNGLQPAQITLTFNAGLCREVVGDLEGAEELYRRALELEGDKDYPNEGLSRIASRHRAAEQMAVHFALQEGEE